MLKVTSEKMLKMTDDSRGRDYEEAVDDSMDLSTTRTVHRIRANSSILQQRKILGQFDWALLIQLPLLNLSTLRQVWKSELLISGVSGEFQLRIEARFVSLSLSSSFARADLSHP